MPPLINEKTPLINPNNPAGYRDNHIELTEKKSSLSKSADPKIVPSFTQQLYTRFSNLVSCTVSYLPNLFSLTNSKINVGSKSGQEIRNRVFYYKNLLNPEDFPVKEINTKREQAYKIPFYNEAKIKDINGTKILDAQELLNFLKQNFQFDDMLIHHDPLLLAVAQNLKLDAAENPHVKTQIGEQFEIVKNELIDRIDNPRQTNAIRLDCANQGRQDKKLEHWIAEDVRVPFSIEQQNAIKNMSI